MAEKLLNLSPYFFGYAVAILINVAPVVVRNLVLPHEPKEDRRDALEASCLYAVATTGLVSVSLSSWIFAIAKVLARLVSEPKTSLAVLVVAAIAGSILLGWRTVKFIVSLHPDNLNSKRGLLGLKMRNTGWIRCFQLTNITLGLIIDVAASYI